MNKSKNCKVCGKFLSPLDAARCNKCTANFHKSCVSFPAKKKDWSCSDCCGKTENNDNMSNPNALNSPYCNPSQMSPGDVSDVAEMRRELALYMAELREYRQEMLEWRSDVHKRLDGLERRMEAVEHRQEEPSTSPKVAELEQVVSQLKCELNDRDQEALLADIDIGNVPESTGENTIHTVSVIATKLGVQLSSSDIVFAERVGAVERSPSGDAAAAEERRARRIVVRLARHELRDELLRAARVRRTLSSADLGAPGAPRRVYVNERLTRTNRALFHQAREECRRLQWRYSWTKRGRIFVRQGDGKPVHVIRTEADMTRVFNCTNVG